MKNRVIIIIAVIVLAGAGFFYLRSKSQITEINSTKVKVQSLNKTIIAPGTLETHKKANLAFEVTGEVANVSTQVGDKVTRNQTLAYLNNRNLREQLKQAQATLDRYVEARKEFREKHKNDQPSNELFAQFAQYDANVRNAQAQVEAARLNLQKAVLTAPLEGTVTEVNIERGELVSAATGTAIVVVNLSPENIYFKAEIDEEDLNEEIRTGEKAKITLDAAGDRPFDGEIFKLSPQTTINKVGDPVLEADIKFISNPSSPTVPEKYHIRGLSGDAEIIIAETPPMPVIPIEALIEKKDEKYVWKIENTRARKTPVKTGLETEFEIAVKEGLKDEDTIATNNLDKLEDGQKVRSIN